MNRIRVHLLAAALCSLGIGYGQEMSSLQGEVRGGPALSSSCAVILTDLSGHRQVASADLSGDGGFAFRQVPRGVYRLTVWDDRDIAAYTAMVTVGDRNAPLLIQLPRGEVTRPPSGLVSARQLLHPPAKKAVEAVVAAQKLSQSGNHEKSAEQLQKAIGLSPDYADAWVNLAAQHIHLGAYQQALGELEHAWELDGPKAMILGNMAFAQHGLHRDREAEQSAREAIRQDPTYAQAHYILGAFLANDRRTLPEAVRHLEIASHSLPSAQSMLERARRDLAQPVVTHP